MAMEGQPIIDLSMVQGPVQPDDAQAPVQLAECGAEALFIGRTRLETHESHGRLVALHYEAYEDMAPKVLGQIALEAGMRYECQFIGLRHSLGRVGIGEASVLVRAMSPHRPGAFGACQDIMNRLKGLAPIWKREVWEDAREVWQEGQVVQTPLLDRKRQSS